MTDPKKREQVARKRTPSPLSSDSYDEMDEDYILINDNTNEVRWVSSVWYFFFMLSQHYPLKAMGRSWRATWI